MISIKYIRDNKDKVKETLLNKNCKVDIDRIISLDHSRRKLLQNVETLRAQRNLVSNKISEMKKQGKNSRDNVIEMQDVSRQIKNIDLELKDIDSDINKHLYFIPNIIHDSVPLGLNSNDNKEIRKWGKKPEFSFNLKNHIEIGNTLQLFDFERATKMAGSGFALYRGLGAKLERALINYMLETHVEKHQYIELLPPYLSNEKSMRNTGQLPKFEDDMYNIKADKLYCIPTAEVPVTNFHQGEVLNEIELPLKYTAYTACFRREAGSYGQQNKGLSRVHQFNKVELVQFVHPNKSYVQLESLLQEAEFILKELGLHYRVIELCSGDLSFSAAKCYDIEVWSPADKRYLEVSSCSNFEDFQAKRSKIKFKNSVTKKNDFVHTLNGSGLATPRLMIALLENNQQEDGSIKIPKPLQKFMNTNKISI